MITQGLIDLIELSEGFRSEPYLDSNGIPTIGWGFTHYTNGFPVTMNDRPITKVDAITILDALLAQFVHAVDAMVPESLNINQRSALYDFAFNAGTGNLKSSTLLKEILANPNDPDIAAQFERWVHGEAGVVLGGLVTRRKAEAKLYFTPVNQA